jgi:hypothetical protein
MNYLFLASWTLVLHSYAGSLATIPNLSKEKCSSLSHYYDFPTTPGFKENADGSECPVGGGACRTPAAGTVVMKDCLNTGD